MPTIASKLKSNLSLNQINNVVVNNIALSDHSGTARLYSGPESNTGATSLRAFDNGAESFEVHLSTFDELVEDFSRVTLVKVDVEGAELKVLRGMEKLMLNVRPTLLVEITDSFLREMGDSAESLIRFVGKFGYVCYVIGDGKVTLLEKMQDELPWQWNALFTVGYHFGEGQVFHFSKAPGN
ncbi:methyltransferase FkbM family [Methylocaldum marinum]|uniref:Methyltransferase FkbM family n=1 Tax=Methylocaldum marinum TaxID=1432792 RepID=A0A250KQE5_9GAMM|nr:FkbM family methyltransferase [Methylocaldum marinum]BBA33817.1 methyltransferase FkbM family [Methylocaldum marinum]